MEIIKISNITWENMAPGTEFPQLQLGVVLVMFKFTLPYTKFLAKTTEK